MKYKLDLQFFGSVKVNANATMTVTSSYVSNNVSNNTSTYKIKIVLSNPHYGGPYAGSGTNHQIRHIITGPGYSWDSGYNDFNYSTLPHTIYHKTVTVTHNSDGTPPSSAISVRQLARSGTAFYADVTATDSIYLPTIPRASGLTLDGSWVTGGTVSVAISRASSSFTHRVRWRMGGGSWTNASTSATTSSSFSVPHSALPNATSGTITVGLQTYNGGTAIGSEVYATRTLTVPSNIEPNFTTINHSEAVSSVNTKVGKYVKNKSKLSLNMIGASAGSGSTIRSYRMTVAGQTAYASSGTTNIITQSGDMNIVGTVTDNRNRSFSKSIAINVLDYTVPALTLLNIDRSKSNGTVDPLGTYARIQEQARAVSLKNGSTEKNSVTVKIETRQRPSGSWVTKNTFNETGLTSNRTGIYSGYVSTSDYDVRITVSDIFESVVLEGGDLYIPTGGANLFVGSKGLASSFGKIPTFGSTYDLEIGSKGLHSDGPIYSSGGLVYPNSYADTRSVNNTPEWYQTNKRLQVTREFKQKSVTGPSSAVGTYIDLSTHVFYADQSGGPVKQVAIDDNGNVYTRTGYGVSWGNWTRVARSNEIPTVPANGGITSGGSQNSRWIKYPDGTQICYGRVINNNPINTAIGGGFRQGGVGVGFPVKFTEVPSVTVTASNYALASTSSVTTTDFSYLLISLDSGRISGWVIWQAIGRWK